MSTSRRRSSRRTFVRHSRLSSALCNKPKRRAHRGQLPQQEVRDLLDRVQILAGKNRRQARLALELWDVFLTSNGV